MNVEEACFLNGILHQIMKIMFLNCISTSGSKRVGYRKLNNETGKYEYNSMDVSLHHLVLPFKTIENSNVSKNNIKKIKI